MHLSVVASPDIAPAVRSVAERARADEVRADGRCLEVEVLARDAHKVADALAAGDAQPDFQVWLPDSELWLERAKGLGEGIPVSPSDSVASSPVAVGMVPSASQALGWPRTTYTWAELVAGTLGSDRVRLGSADPARSATGLLALAGIGASSARQGGDSDTRVAETAKVLAERMSDGDAQVLETLARSDSGAEQGNPKRNQAVLISEQAAFTHNAEATGGGRLDLFYPEDGTPLLDYPYTLVNEPELSIPESRAALRFMNLLSDEKAAATFAEHGSAPVTEARRTPSSPRPAAGSPSPTPSRPPRRRRPRSSRRPWDVDHHRAERPADHGGRRLRLHGDARAGPGQSRMDVTKESLIQALDQFTPNDEIGLWEFATTLDGEKDYRGSCRRGGSATRRRAAGPTGRSSPPRSRDCSRFRAGRPGCTTPCWPRTRRPARRTSRGSSTPWWSSRTGPTRTRTHLAERAGREVEGARRSGAPRPGHRHRGRPGGGPRRGRRDRPVTGGDGYEVSDPAEIQGVILQAIMTAGQNGRAGQE